MVRLLKLSNYKYEDISSSDILSMHIGHLDTYRKVVFSTDLEVSSKPEYVVLVLGNADEFCYLCHVDDYEYYGEQKGYPTKWEKYLPDQYKKDDKETFLLLDSMQSIPIDFLEALGVTEIRDFIKSRANNKVIG